ncbi:beta/gamma crystallin-related protein [Brevundimonas sp.]|uniref:beta/gamma crystallin-related protein n=1 Tax=Brevundimonas sp. TaxID=1871086 RepID=UPI002D5CE1A0|nr:beta/gamma crystallin-related protein [Brevundimonas sp.]HYC74745.1 beta/gamma crystallin-related protein [Brevundimonas sp.]
MTPSVLLLAFLSLVAPPGESPPVQASGAGPAAATLYRDVGYRGPSITVTGSRPDLNLPWPVRSIRIQSGVWELCQRANFRGRCTRYDSSDSSIPSAREYTQSARPATPVRSG